MSGGRVIESSGIGEGEFLKEKAIEQGVDKEDIFVEREAMTTWENMQFSREIIIKNGLLKEAMNVAIVTSSFHMRRSLVIAKRIFENDPRNTVFSMTKFCTHGIGCVLYLSTPY